MKETTEAEKNNIDTESLPRLGMLSTLVEDAKKKAREANGVEWKIAGLFPIREVWFYILLFLIAIASHFSGVRDHLGDVPLFSFLKSVNLSATESQNLISILTGMGAVIFGLFIFVADNFKAEASRDRGRILLRKSHLLYITIAEVGLLLIFLDGSVNVLVELSILALGACTIYALSRVVSLSLSNTKYLRERNEFLKDRLKSSVEKAIDHRLGFNILAEKLVEYRIPIEYVLFTTKDEVDFEEFFLPVGSYIYDIDFKKLSSFANDIEKWANENNQSFWPDSKNSVRQARISTSDSSPDQAAEERLGYNRGCYILLSYLDKVDGPGRAAIKIDQRLIKGVDPRQLNRWRREVKSIFKYREDSNFSADVRSEIAEIKDRLIINIKEGRLGQIDDLLPAYEALSEAFLESMKSINNLHSATIAQGEMGFFSGWSEIKWLVDDYEEVLSEALSTNNIHIVEKVVSLNYVLLVQAINWGDHYIFQQFIQNYLRLYREIYSEGIDTKIKIYLKEVVQLHLGEITEMYALSRIRDCKDREGKEQNNLKDFVISYLKLQQQILLETIRSRNLDDFISIIKATNRRLSHFRPSNTNRNAALYEIRLRNQSLGEELRSELEEKYKEQIILENIEKEIRDRKNQMFFGICSWILDCYLDAEDFPSRKDLLLEAISTSSLEMKDLYDLYGEITRLEAENFWGWDWWGARLEDDSAFFRLGSDERHKLLFCILALKNFRNIGAAVILSDKEWSRHDLEELLQFVEGMRADREKYAEILSDEEWANISRFITQLKEVIQLIEDNEKKHILESPLSEDKVEAFKKEVVASFREEVVVRDFYGKYLERVEGFGEPYTFSSTKERFGIHTIGEKNPFIEGLASLYSKWGSVQGDDIGRSENSYFIEKLRENSEELSSDELLHKINELREGKYIIFCTHLIVLHDLEEGIVPFKPKWQEGLPKEPNIKGFAGWMAGKYINIPVVEINSHTSDKQLLLLNEDNCGTLVQECPVNEASDIDKIYDIFYIDVSAFSSDEKLFSNLLQNTPDWLKKIGDQDRQKEYLLPKVAIRISEKMHLNIPEDFEGFYANFLDEEK